jgi:hypothetical protein
MIRAVKNDELSSRQVVVTQRSQKTRSGGGECHRGAVDILIVYGLRSVLFILLTSSRSRSSGKKHCPQDMDCFGRRTGHRQDEKATTHRHQRWRVVLDDQGKIQLIPCFHCRLARFRCYKSSQRNAFSGLTTCLSAPSSDCG